MNITDELEKLAELRHRGVLSAEQFEVGKTKILNGPNNIGNSSRLDEIKVQNEIAELDREWNLQRDNYQISGKYGRRYIPSRIGSVISGVIIVAFGIFWTSMAAGMSGGMNGGPVAFFPLFGVLFFIGGAVMSIRGFAKACQYDQAQQRYHQRRSELQKKR